MTTLRFIFLATQMLFACFTGFSQTSKTIDSLETQYQICLDKGEYMLGCSKAFYAQMDSMLNIVYIKLRSNIDVSNQAELKKKQKMWLVKRDAYFKKTLKAFKENNPSISPVGSADGARDDAMIMYDDNAQFVKAKILELLKHVSSLHLQDSTGQSIVPEK